MKLNLIQYPIDFLLLEQEHVPTGAGGYGRVWAFQYGNWHNDPRPKALKLGEWRHPSTRNRLVCGINLNYIDDDELMDLRRALKDILRTRDMKRRYWIGRRHKLPRVRKVFELYYRTYNADYVHAITPGVLKHYVDEVVARRLSQRAKRGWETRRNRAAERRGEPETDIREPKTILTGRLKKKRDEIVSRLNRGTSVQRAEARRELERFDAEVEKLKRAEKPELEEIGGAHEEIE